MANTGSPGTGGRRRCGAVTRVDLLTVLVAAMLCSASYCLGIWHNSRGAADSRVLGPSVAAACGGDEPLDFEAHHSAEGAGLSVSVSPSSSKETTTSTRRALRGAAPAGDWWAGRIDGGSFRFVRAVRG